MTKQTTRSHTKNRPSFHSKAFGEGLEILKDEIQLAFQWQRPSILLAIHNSRHEQPKAQQSLEKELLKMNKRVEWIKATEQTLDVIIEICKAPNRDEIVFFVSEIGNADNPTSTTIYHALNMHREILVEQHIRVIFWLTKSEASELPHHAPDFWAFRHRVVEFASRGAVKK